MREWRNCQADVIVLTRDPMVGGALGIYLLVYVYLMNLSASFLADVTQVGYFGRQGLLNAALFGRYAVVVAAAALGARDGDWGTWALRLAGTTRQTMLASRFMVVIGLAVVMSVVSWLPGLALDAVAGVGVVVNPATLAQILLTVWDICVWAVVAFAIASAAGFVVGGAGTIIYAFVELWAEPRLPGQVLTVLPQWNITTVLRAVFPTDEPGIGPIAVHQGILAQGLLVTLLYLVGSGAIARHVLLRREF
ncbi:MAG: hypothetical protein ACK5LN_08975 [Propioniciclava sp.]